MKLATSAGSSGLIALALFFGAPTSTQAGSVFSPPVGSVTTIVTPTTGGYDWDYRVTLTSGAPLGAIEIPEISAGDLLATLTLPASWSGAEIGSPAFADPILKSGATPGAWILLTSDNFDYYIFPGATVDFNLFSTLGGQAGAEVSAAYREDGSYPGGLNFTTDPSTPTSAPEPSTWALMILGALGLIALRRKGVLAANTPPSNQTRSFCGKAASCSGPLVLALGVLVGFHSSGRAGIPIPAAQVSVDVTVTPSGAGYDWDYRVTVTNADQFAVAGAIEIPEVALGYLGLSTFTLPVGWTGAELTSPEFLDPLIKPNGAPGGWIVLQTLDSADFIGTGNNPVDFNLYSTFGGGVQAEIAAAIPFVSGDQTIYVAATLVDPLTPSPVPEPSTWAMMGVGALGLIALRRRKRALVPARA